MNSVSVSLSSLARGLSLRIHSPLPLSLAPFQANSAIVYGLRPGVSYSFRVYAGNLYKRETVGIGTTAVMIPPVSPISTSVTGLRVVYVMETQVCVCLREYAMYLSSAYMRMAAE
jgi:hypothetical protein